MRAASIGWTLVVTFPTHDHGTDMLAGVWAGRAREQICLGVHFARHPAHFTVGEAEVEGADLRAPLHELGALAPRPRQEALDFFAKRGEPLKVQLIEEKTAGQSHVSCYTIKDRDTFVDFCVGPHVPSTGRLKAFKLISTSNAYWKGDARNQPMQRIYGTAFLSDKELKAYLTQIEEAKKRDHRKLGRELGLFTFHHWAPGAAFWLDKGTTLYTTLANYMRDVLLPSGYIEVKTPLIFNKALWETSGHWSHYRQNMFQVEGSEGEEMAIKAMNCPGHFLLYGTTVHSYRELPIRFHEQTPLHRNELAGVLSGLTRVRQFSQDDGHCFVMPEQIGDEVERLLKLVRRVYNDLGMTCQPKLATRPDEYLGEKATWDEAEAQLRGALEKAGEAYTLDEGGGNFYGPKIDFDVTDAIGRKWQCATIQLDYEQPRNFDLKYIGADNTEHRPIVIHRAIFGSMERFIAILVEHYAGAFPLWLAPVQAIVLPISDRHLAYGVLVRDRLHAAGLRVVLDERQEKIGFKIREAQLQKVPYMLVVGDRESHDGTISVRTRTGGDQGASTVDAFIVAAPATNGTNVRTIGTKRPDTTAMPPCFSKNARNDERISCEVIALYCRSGGARARVRRPGNRGP